jgi:hypothetical protein
MAEKQIRVEVFRGREEQFFDPGQKIEVKPGVTGTVLCRFAPKSDPAKVGYLVEPSMN